MKTLNFNFNILDLDGKIIEAAVRTVANHLVTKTEGDAIKYYDWATKIYKLESISVDAADYKTLYDSINLSPTMNIIAKGPILKYLNSVKEDEIPK